MDMQVTPPKASYLTYLQGPPPHLHVNRTQI